MATVESSEDRPKGLFPDLTAEDDSPDVTVVESYCVNCEKQGTTRLMLTRIPFFKEVIVSSFTCEDCGFHNAELIPGSSTQDKGVLYRLTVRSSKDLNRQVVQTNAATVKIPCLDFEAPPNKGVLTTIEGLLQRVLDGLQQDQPLRRIQHLEDAQKIDEFCERLSKLKEVQEPFEMILDDPTGNSFLENPHAPSKDPDLSVTRYERTREQDIALGLVNPEEEENNTEPTEQVPQKDEVLEFQTNCNNCHAVCSTKMKLVEIPHFKEVVIMATTCDVCGHRDSEVKSSGGIEPKGRRITLRITDPTDLNRDVLKSETCSIAIPELEFETESGTLGGKFTTVEGLLTSVKEQLTTSNPFFKGDSSNPDLMHRLQAFCDKLDKVISGETLNVTLVLDDPAGNSYLQNTYAPEEDPEMTVEEYERNYDQNEILGLNDMKTENYES